MTEFLVNTDTTGQSSTPTIDVLPNGNFIVTWSRSDIAQTEQEIYAQMFSPTYQKIGSEFMVAADGTKSGTEFVINSSAEANIYNVDVMQLPDGGFLAAWSGANGPNFSTNLIFDVYAQSYDANGDVVISEFLVNTHQPMMQQSPKIAAHTDGSFVIVWASYLQDGDNMGIYAQRFSASGQKVEIEFLVNTHTANRKIYQTL